MSTQYTSMQGITACTKPFSNCKSTKNWCFAQVTTHYVMFMKLANQISIRDLGKASISTGNPKMTYLAADQNELSKATHNIVKVWQEHIINLHRYYWLKKVSTNTEWVNVTSIQVTLPTLASYQTTTTNNLNCTYEWIKQHLTKPITSPLTATGRSNMPCMPRMADCGGLMIGVPINEPKTPPLLIVNVPPSISSTARSPFLAYSINITCYNVSRLSQLATDRVAQI